jgi:2-polyprenyl-6-hydroxyphenyl methylase / 3-demethylubiquinone-9 3-methyltransferase
MTAVPAEIARFNRLAATWWDARGPMRPLHVINRLRLDYLRQLLATHFGATPAGLRVLDVGCGAGLLAEPLAALGAQVTAIDAAEKNIAAARLHAAASGVSVDYRVGELTNTLAADARFDLVTLLEVVEHVDDVPATIDAAARRVAPGGLLVASTIDRTAKSWLFAIVGAEFLFRVLPVGTHQWRRFVRPDEMQAAAHAAGLRRIDLRGMRYLPVLHRADWIRDTSVNYLAAFAR